MICILPQTRLFQASLPALPNMEWFIGYLEINRSQKMNGGEAGKQEPSALNHLTLLT
jgi:hypothetical protein